MEQVAVRRPLRASLSRGLFVIYVATNMLLCAIIFNVWALPRETISGFLGRMACTSESKFRRGCAKFGVRVANLVYFWEEEHCALVYSQELEARRALYGDTHG